MKYAEAFGTPPAAMAVDWMPNSVTMIRAIQMRM